MKTVVILINTILLCLFASMSGCGNTQLSTHHVLLRMQINPHGINGGSATKLRKSRVKGLLASSISTLNEAGLVAVTDPNVPFNIVAFGNRAELRALKYKSQTVGEDMGTPLEALISYDAEEYEDISITVSQGYASKPSERLVELYYALDQLFDQTDGRKYLSKLN
jgi:hypothetical protein